MHRRLSSVKRIDYSLYFLHPKQAGRKKREGALLKVEFEDCIGYADCHPWPEIGDDPLHMQLHRLSLRTPTQLCKHTLDWAYIDGKARARGEPLIQLSPDIKKVKTGLSSLYDSVHYSKVPQSHYLILQLDESTSALFAKGLNEGFTRFKIKMNSFSEETFSEFERLIKLCQLNNVKLRLDLNEHFNQMQFEDFITKFADYKPWIDYVEDPFPFELQSWKDSADKHNISFACDVRNHYPSHHLKEIPILVIKPAIYPMEKIEQIAHSKVVFTSYAAHPIEQMTAAYAAAKISQAHTDHNVLAGLLSHKVYKKNAFSERFQKRGPTFYPVEGNGFGFDDLLEQQKWIKLWAHSR